MDYESSPAPFARHRALFLVSPITVDMTGQYTCKVSTLQNEVQATKSMVVYGQYSIKNPIPFTNSTCPCQVNLNYKLNIRNECTFVIRMACCVYSNNKPPPQQCNIMAISDLFSILSCHIIRSVLVIWRSTNQQHCMGEGEKVGEPKKMKKAHSSLFAYMGHTSLHAIQYKKVLFRTVPDKDIDESLISLFFPFYCTVAQRLFCLFDKLDP